MTRHVVYPRQYVKVRADFDFNGHIIPLKFRTEQGTAMLIDRILDVREAPSLKCGGQGTRYTCRVGDQLIYLFHDDTSWFVEWLA